MAKKPRRSASKKGRVAASTAEAAATDTTAASSANKKPPQWRPVELGASSSSKSKDTAAASTDSKILSYNHYDDDDPDDNDNHDDKEAQKRSHKRRKRASSLDLEAEPSEASAIFYSLEVLDDVSAYIVREREQAVKPKAIAKPATKEAAAVAAETAAKEPSTAVTALVEPNTSTADAKASETAKTKKQKAKESRDKAANTRAAGTAGAAAPVNETTDTAKNKAKKATCATDAPQARPESTQNQKKKPQGTKKMAATDDSTTSATAATATTTAALDLSNKDKYALLHSVSETWRVASGGGLVLHDAILSSLLRLYGKQCTPTPIQAATLASSILGRRNLVGAAPTGSGKTLAFVLPILQALLEEEGTLGQDDNDDDHSTATSAVSTKAAAKTYTRKLQALILAPTRELAQQIHAVVQSFIKPAKPDQTGPNATNRDEQVVSKTTITCACITGGLAVAKQARVLNQRPAIVIATPGRLWELISSRQYEHLNDLSHIRFLVIDEADRMVRVVANTNANQKKKKGESTTQASSSTSPGGGFVELRKILDAVQKANPDPLDENDDDGDENDDDDAPERLRGLPGFPGEAHVEMLPASLLERLNDPNVNQDDEADDDDAAIGNSSDMRDDDDDDKNDDEEEEDIYIGFDDDDVNDLNKLGGADGGGRSEMEHEPDDDADDAFEIMTPRVHRQTFIFSATLALPNSSGETRDSKRKRSDKQDSGIAWKNVGGAIAEILQKAKAVGPTKVVDLTNAANATSSAVGGASSQQAPSKGDKALKEPKQPSKQKFQLPPGLQLQQIKCTQLHKDSHLYAYLKTTEGGTAGPALVFCNSVAAVRRVGATLSTLGLPVRMLHAQMQQRSRFKAIESLQAKSSSDQPPKTAKNVIVVATDVAARGLDIPSVATVIHYDAARNMETFVHRSGRTARGMGDAAVGSSLSLVASNEDKFHSKIVKSLNLTFADVVMDGRLLSGAQERVNLASKVTLVEDSERKKQRDNQWFKDQAADAGLDVDDDLLTDDLVDGSSKDKARWKEAQQARERLRVLLAQPMQTQRFGKFLSTNSAATQRTVAADIVPVRPSKPSKKKRRRVR